VRDHRAGARQGALPQLAVRQLARGSSTELVLRKLSVNPEIDDRIFSVRTLDQQRPLPRVRVER